jgi:signal transduction histidine kinase/ActR/RegA family two-component response regulator
MSPNARRNSSRSPAGRVALFCLAAFLRLAAGCSGAEAQATSVTTVNSAPFTHLQQLWDASVTNPNGRYRIRLDYVVYYYDPLWSMAWGRDTDGPSYLSFGAKVFPIKAGQRIRVEGVLPANGSLNVEDPVVTVLEDAVPLEAEPLAGRFGDPAKLESHWVSVEGYVETPRFADSGHVEFPLITEGHVVTMSLLLRNEGPPQLVGLKVRARGVLAMNDRLNPAAGVRLYVPSREDVTVLGTFSSEASFAEPAKAFSDLAQADAREFVHVVGKVKTAEPRKYVVITDGAAELIAHSAQSTPLIVGNSVDVIGRPAKEDGRIVLREALYRPLESAVTTFPLIEAIDDKKPGPTRVRFDAKIQYFDPYWKVLWSLVDGQMGYLSLRSGGLDLSPGEQVIIEGNVLGASRRDVTDVKLTRIHGPEKLVPVSTLGETGNIEKFSNKYVSIEGYVDRQALTDEHHLELNLVADDRAVVCRVLMGGGAAVPNFEDHLVRINGVYAATQDPGSSNQPLIELWVPGLSEIGSRNSLIADERFNLPTTPIDQLSSAAGKLVHVVGVVRSQEPGRSITLRDGTGQLDVYTPQARVMPVGHPIEAVGIPVFERNNWVLRNATFRRSQKAVSSSDETKTIRLTDQLRELSSEDAARAVPVRLSGVVVWDRTNADFFYIHDATGCARVYRPPNSKPMGALGAKIEVTGVSAPGQFTPVVLADKVSIFSTLEMPEARTITLDQALTGSEEGQWVMMSGYVRAIENEAPWVKIILSTPAGEFEAMLAPNDRWARLPGSVVHVRGVCSAVANGKRQLTGIRVWVPMSRLVEVEEAAPADPFALEARPLASLSQFNALPSANRRVRVSGTVIYHEPGRVVHIQDGSEAGVVLSRDTTPLSPGDRVDVVGFPGRENGHAVLREAVYRRIATGAAIVPVEIGSISTLNRDLDGRLVRVTGVLASSRTHDKGERLVMQSNQSYFEALLDFPTGKIPAGKLTSGARLALTGVYTIEYDEYHQPHTLRLLLRSPADVELIQAAPWWTVRRALWAVAILAIGTLLGLGGVVALRRRVRQQTDVIRQQVESERAARLEAALARASKLESLGVLAGGIAHDFNNLLTVVMGNLSLARLDPNIDAETVHCLSESERAAMRARDLTRQLLTFAKGGAPMKASTRLPDIVREAAEFALHGSKSRCEFRFAPNVWLADADKAQIGQVVHNIVINANEAMPHGGTIQVVMANEELASARGPLTPGRYVRMSFTDNGAGISPEIVARIFDPYFTTKKSGSGLGLATVYSIVKKHQGHVEVTSQPGQGTTFTIWLPAADEPAAELEAPKVTAHVAAKKSARVLLMDDEPSIRMLGATMLKRMGLEVTAVNDGSAVVNEYASATAAGKRYDLVILDLTVPGGMGGAEAMEQLRAMDANVRAIVSSGYSSDPVMANYQRHGFHGRVPKPYVTEDLSSVVKKVLDLEPAGAS